MEWILCVIALAWFTCVVVLLWTLARSKRMDIEGEERERNREG